MSEHTRRDVLGLSGAVGAGALAGCLGTTPDAPPPTALDAVPATATGVLHLDVASLLADELTERTVEDALSLLDQHRPAYAGPTSLEAALASVEDATGLPLSALTEATAFVDADAANPEWGCVLATEEWAPGDVLNATERRGVSLVSSSYRGRTLYRTGGGDGALVALPEGRYAVGTVEGVRAVLDVAVGDADPVAGPVADAYYDAPAGMVRFAAAVPDGAVPDRGGAAFDLSALGAVEHVGGAISAAGDRRSLDLRLAAADAAAAGDVADVLDGGLTLLATRLSEDDALDGEFGDGVEQLDAVTVSRTDRTVSLDYAAPVGEFAAAATLGLAAAGTFVLGVVGTDGRPVPQASFAFDYDADAGTVTVTHVSGETVPADALSVRAGGQSRSWAALGGDDTVRAGDSVTVSVSPGTAVRVVYRGEGAATTLAEYDVPD